MTKRGLFLALLVLQSAGQIASAQTCNSAALETAPASQFTDQGDGTVLDTVTNLVWKRCGEGHEWLSASSTCDGSLSTFTWQGALDQVDYVNSEGYADQTDWRLPNLKELRSIVEYQCYGPSVNETIFPETDDEEYWSSSTISTSTGVGATTAFAIDFEYGDEETYDKDDEYPVRLVRGGE